MDNKECTILENIKFLISGENFLDIWRTWKIIDNPPNAVMADNT